MDPKRHPDALISRIRARMIFQKWMRVACLCLSISSGVLLSVGCLRLLIGVPPVSGVLLGIWLTAGVVMLLISRALIRVSSRSAAASLDACLPESGDRFLTWCSLPFSGTSSAWNEYIRKEIEAFSQSVSMPQQTRWLSHRVRGPLLMIWLGIVVLQGMFYLGQQSSASERNELAALLMKAAEDIQRTAPELPAISQVLESEAERLRQNRVQNPRDAGVRSLSAAAAEIRALAASTSQKIAPSSDAKPKVGHAEPQAARTPSPTAAMPDLPVTADASLSNTSSDLSPEKSRRLERLASRLDEKKRSAAGLGDSARGDGSDSDGKDESDQKGSSLLDQLAAGNNPSSPGPIASDLAAPGPGSEKDFGSADMQQSLAESLDAVTGPELSAEVPTSQNETGTRFSVISRESGNNTFVEPSNQPSVALEFQEQTMDLEDIPLGAREMVLRYFDLVRANQE